MLRASCHGRRQVVAGDLAAECTHEAALRCRGDELTMRSIVAASAPDAFQWGADVRRAFWNIVRKLS
jgi:hypothetical protein